jgi:Na+/phosphate symporter
MSLQSTILNAALQNPLFMGVVFKAANDAIHSFLSGVQAEVKVQPWLQPLSVGLALLAGLASSAMAGTLGTVDLTSLGTLVTNYVVPALVGVNAAGTATVSALAANAKAAVTPPST